LPTNALFGFTSMLLKLLKDEKPEMMGVVFDVARKTFRNEKYPAYKANRDELATLLAKRLEIEPDLAAQVADQLMAHDALGAHARDELGMSEATRARPIQAALASAAAFAVGAAPPLLLALFLPTAGLTPVVAGSSLVLLSVLGATAAHLGAASVVRGAARVAFWGAVAMGSTALVGRFFGTVA
jgi:VIT1/CCC1 family predicted Fe2+/Mn2+ transporter